MVAADGYLKLIDYGVAVDISRQKDEKAYTKAGTLIYMAPEVLKSETGGNGYAYEADWWSVGILLYKLYMNNFCDLPYPFHG